MILPAQKQQWTLTLNAERFYTFCADLRDHVLSF
jgi:hypothetical protein